MSNVLDDIRGHARRDPAHPALVSGGSAARGEADATLDYASLVAGFEARARRLRESGLKPGERCGLVARQGAGFVEAALGILAADACLVPIPDDHQGAVLDDFADRASLHHLVLESEDFACRTLPTPAPVDGRGEAEFGALRPAYLRFTSGTTAERKGVVIGHDAIAARLSAANRGLGVGPRDRILWLLPMAHHFVVSILLYLRYGASVLLPASSLARDVLALAERAGATLFYASPYHYQLLAKDASDRRLSQVRLAISTAEGLRPEIAQGFRERFGFPLAQALGIIEVGLPVLNRDAALTRPESLGRPLPDYEVWLRDEEGKPVEGRGPDCSGEVCIRGPGLFDAYLEPWLPARRLIEPDGFRTGDQGWFDAEGQLTLAGRRRNRINMAGMKFFAEEVEAVLDAHPQVARSRVSAREHAHLGQIPVAEFCAADPDAPPDPRALRAHCREQLAPYKVPREFQRVDALALTPTGKLERR